MDSGWYRRAGLLAFFTIVAALYVVPNLAFPREQKADGHEGDILVPSWYPVKSTIRLGLDLKGGIHLVLGVEWQKALEDDALRKAKNIEEWAKRESVPLESVKGRGLNVAAIFKSADDLNAHSGKLLEQWAIFKRVPGEGDDRTVLLAYSPEETDNLRRGALQQAIEIIRRRIDPEGTGEVGISVVGDSDIMVELPGFSDVDRVQDLLGQTAQLAFQIVDDSAPAKTLFDSLKGKLPAGAKIDSDGEQQFVRITDAAVFAEVRKLVGGVTVPEGLEVKWEKEADATIPDKYGYRSYILKQLVELTGDQLSDARVAVDQQDKPYVSLTFNPTGAVTFAELTGANVGKRLAIVLDDEVRSAPVLKEKIAQGRAQITMGGLKSRQQLFEEAKDLAVVLRSGALPAPLKIEEIRQVGATLGADAIRKGILSLIIGSVAVVLFMLVYYRQAGVYANVALLLNTLFVFALLNAFGATLTLPGLAGIVLTLGMAVDANVIINERIREELRLGKSPRQAVEAGYDRAFSAILDSNLTTAIAGVVLYQFGSGPVQGFAVTLMLGIVTSMYTALSGSRILFDYGTARSRSATLSI